MSKSDRPSAPHICGTCGSTEIIKTRVSDEIVWLCKCGERWRAHNQDWDTMPKFVKGKRVYKKDAKSRGKIPEKHGRKMKP